MEQEDALERFHQALKGIEWALSRDPERYLGNNTNVGTISTRSILGLSPYRIMFILMCERVEMHAIDEKVPEGEFGDD